MHEDGDGALVTYLARAGVPRPVVVGDRVLLESDSSVVWFTFPGAWHDIGRFHAPDGRFTGLYANVLTPVEVEGDTWRTTDLFLDVVFEPGHDPVVLDRHELDRAVREGWLDPETAARAEAEADRLLREAGGGAWPPAVVRDWTLDRARRAAGH